MIRRNEREAEQAFPAGLPLIETGTESEESAGRATPRIGPGNVQKIFVSYSHADSALVAPVVRLLRAARSFVFLDVDSIEPALKWQNVIQTAIGDADLVVLFWCFHSSGSQEVEREWTAAISLNKPLLPVLLDSTPVTAPISQFQWIDFKELGETRHPPPAEARPAPAAPRPASHGPVPLLAFASAAALCVSLLGALWLSIPSASPPPPLSTTLLAAATPTPTRVDVTPAPSPGPTATPPPTLPGQPGLYRVSALAVLALFLLVAVLAIRARRQRSRNEGWTAGEKEVSVEARMADAIHSELVRRLEPHDGEPPGSR
jgi:hypothetical protein